ncbi:MAG: FAD-dependent oxidoreductase [Paludibacteraceae bacterium]|nr:FAD-dependent oxidoreductase [Paludibacteraceae bacterium]
MDLIIGAGISGISYAAATKNDYLIIEQSDSIGGYCKTINQDGFTWDYSGHFFHFQRPEIKDYVMKNLKEEDMLKVFKHTQIYYKGLLVDYPFQMNIHQLEKEEFIDCLYDLFSKKEDTCVSSFKAMLYAKFGKSIAEKFLIPYNEKLYAVDLDKLDVDAMGRFFPYADKEQIVLNFRNAKDQSYNSFFLYPKKGAFQIVESIASRLEKDKISLNEKLVSVDRERKIARTDKREIHYDNLISTIPFPDLLEKSGVEYDKSVYSWNKVLVFNLGFDKKGSQKRNNWIYFPDKNLSFYRVGFYDNIIGQNRMSLYVEIGFNKESQGNVDMSCLLDRVLSDLKKVGIVNDEKLVSYCSVMMNPAYVHITKSSEIDKVSKMNLLKSSDIYSIGRYGAWKYCSLEDNIYDAQMLADRL